MTALAVVGLFNIIGSYGCGVLGGRYSKRLILAWIYVGLRAAHSVVHLTYNNVVHRLAVYAASALVLALLWIRFVMALK